MSDPLRLRLVADMPLLEPGHELFRTAEGEPVKRGERVELVIDISPEELRVAPDPRRRARLALEALVREFMRTHMPHPEPRMSLAEVRAAVREGLKPRKD